MTARGPSAPVDQTTEDVPTAATETVDPTEVERLSAERQTIHEAQERRRAELAALEAEAERARAALADLDAERELRGVDNAKPIRRGEERISEIERALRAKRRALEVEDAREQALEAAELDARDADYARRIAAEEAARTAAEQRLRPALEAACAVAAESMAAQARLDNLEAERARFNEKHRGIRRRDSDARESDLIRYFRERLGRLRDVGTLEDA